MLSASVVLLANRLRLVARMRFGPQLCYCLLQDAPSFPVGGVRASYLHVRSHVLLSYATGERDARSDRHAQRSTTRTTLMPATGAQFQRDSQWIVKWKQFGTRKRPRRPEF
jgi:hypothetical protein